MYENLEEMAPRIAISDQNTVVISSSKAKFMKNVTRIFVHA